MTRKQKHELLKRIFSTKEGTRKAYKAAQLPCPKFISNDFIERVVNFEIAILLDLKDLKVDTEKNDRKKEDN
jgi:hypothetical protein